MVAVATLAALSVPVGGQGNRGPDRPPDTPPGLERKTDPTRARAQNAAEPALQALGRHTYILEQSDTAPTPTASSRNGRSELTPGGGLGIGVDIAPGQLKRSSQPGVAHARTGQPHSDYFVQNLEGDRGMRVIVSLEGPEAPTDYSFDLNLPNGAIILEAADGTVGIGLDDELLGTIPLPWAIDADGRSVPVSQTVSETEIVLSVDTKAVSVWPVIADPTYYNYTSCVVPTTTATAAAYASGYACAPLFHNFANGYFPVWIEHFNRWQVGQPENFGDTCSWMPDRLNIWGYGAIYDYRQACKVHDYLSDLGGQRNYPSVGRLDVDNIMRDLMYWDCQHRSGSIWYPSPQQDCFIAANGAYANVRDCFWCWW